MRIRIIVAALAASLALPAAAGATIVYQKGIAKGKIWVAKDDGSDPRKLARGSQPTITPDGKTVVYLETVGRDGFRLRELSVAGGDPRTVVAQADVGPVAISNNSRYIAALAKARGQASRLVLFDRTTGKRRDVARGYIQGASFSPESSRLVFGYAPKLTAFPRINLFVADVIAGRALAITDDDRSAGPVWGPERIVFSRYTRPKREGDGPKYNLYTVAADGTDRQALTHDKVPFLLSGLFAVEWSASGEELVAEFGGQDTLYPVTVDPQTGEQDFVGRKNQAILATALSRDGKQILGFTNPFNFPGSPQNVVTIPYAGGKPKVIVRKAVFPDWSR